MYCLLYLIWTHVFMPSTFCQSASSVLGTVVRVLCTVLTSLFSLSFSYGQDVLELVTRKDEGREREMEWEMSHFSLSDNVVFHQALLFSLGNGCQVVGGKRAVFFLFTLGVILWWRQTVVKLKTFARTCPLTLFFILCRPKHVMFNSFCVRLKCMIYYIKMVIMVTVLQNVVSSKTFVRLQCKWKLSLLKPAMIVFLATLEQHKMQHWP